MFHVDVTLEDTRIIARTDAVSTDFDCQFIDNLSGKIWEKKLTPEQLGATIALAMASDGETVPPVNHALVEPLFQGCPQECRPIC